MTEDQIINLFGSGQVKEAMEAAKQAGFDTLYNNFSAALAHMSNLPDYYEHYKQNNGRIPGAQIEMGGGPDARQKVAMRHIAALNATSLLDIGCADGSFCFFCLKDNIVQEVLGIDPWVLGITWAKEYASRINLRATFIPALFEDISLCVGTFDVVHLGEILEHVIDPVAILRSLRKYHPKGVVVTVPMERPPVTPDEKVVLTDGRVAEHVRLITPTLLNEYCKGSGFEIVRSDIIGTGWVNLIATIV